MLTEKQKKDRERDKKRFSRTKLIDEADRVASLYIRERDKGKPCITCEKPWQESHQCGHFLSRRHLATRFHEKNMNGQCVGCNNWGSGEQYKHGLAIDKLYGEGTAQQLSRLANDVSKTTDEEILHYIRLYYYELSQFGWSNEMILIKKYYL